jgi:hypothetical protein
MRIISIIGCGRSGSTLLEGVMHERLDLTALGEVTFIWEKGRIKNERCGCDMAFHECEFWSAVLSDAFGTISDADARRYDAAFQTARGHLLNPALVAGHFPEPDPLFREVARALYASAFKVGGNRPLVDSSKSGAWAAALHKAGVGRRLDSLHIFRDACGNVHSLRTEKERPHSVGSDFAKIPASKTLFHAIAFWKIRNGQAEQFVRRVDPAAATMSYEHLCTDPKGHLEAIMRAFELEPRRGKAQMSWHSVSGNPMRFDSDIRPIRLDDRWKREMSRFDQAVTGLLTAGEQRRLEAAAQRWATHNVKAPGPTAGRKKQKRVAGAYSD